MLLDHKNRFVIIILIIAFCVFLLRLLIFVESFHSALLYIGVPFLIAVLLLYTTNYSRNARWTTGYLNNIRDSVIIMLASSIILHEGFLCVLMFLPIYFLIILIVFSLHALFRNISNRRNRNYAHVFSVIIAVALSLEGVHPSVSFNRDYTVQVTRIVNADIATLKNNLRAPIKLGGDTPWFLSVFPMPYQVQAGSIEKGAVHIIRYEYKRWFFTNTHRGEMHLRIKDTGPTFVETEFIKDTSYISTYVSLNGTRIDFTALANGKTRVTLKFNYIRKLDPSWYFGPMERYAMSKTAEYMMTKIIVRNADTYSPEGKTKGNSL